MNQPHLITPEQLAGMDRFYRMNLINSLSGYKQPFLVGTIDGRNRTNLGLFNSLVHIGAQPARLGFFIRPLTVPRHTYHNIIERKKFTINLVPEAFIEAAPLDVGIIDLDAGLRLLCAAGYTAVRTCFIN